MRLETYLREHRMTDIRFGARIGVSRFTVGKWRRGERTPRPELLARIVEATNGKVTANDFLPENHSAH